MTRKGTGPSFDVEAGLQELRGTGMMEWVCLLSPVLQSGSVPMAHIPPAH